MSVAPDKLHEKKGLFHGWTGVPFYTCVTGNSAQYQNLIRQRDLIESDRTALLRLQPELTRQYDDLSQTQTMLLSSLAENNHDIARAEQNQREAAANLERIEFESPLSTQPRLNLKRVRDVAIGRIPVLGWMYSGTQAALHVRDRVEANRVLEIETQALADVRQFGQEQQLRLALSQKTARELVARQESHQKMLAALAVQRVALDKDLEAIS